MTQHEEWSPEQERDTHIAHAQALVEAVAVYEAAHPNGTPCFHDALAIMRQELEP